MYQKQIPINKTDELDIRVDGCSDLNDGRRRDQLHPYRRWHDLTCGRGNILRIAAAGQKRDAGVVDGPVRNVLAYLSDCPGSLEADDRANSRLRGVMSLPLEQIGTVHARCRDLDQHLVGPRPGGLDLSQLEHVRRTWRPCDDGFHAPQRAIGGVLELLAHRAWDPPTSASLADDEACLLPPPQHGGARFPTLAAPGSRLGSGCSPSSRAPDRAGRGRIVD